MPGILIFPIIQWPFLINTYNLQINYETPTYYLKCKISLTLLLTRQERLTNDLFSGKRLLQLNHRKCQKNQAQILLFLSKKQGLTKIHYDCIILHITCHLNFCISLFTISTNTMFSKINFSRSYTEASVEIVEKVENTFFKSNL